MFLKTRIIFQFQFKKTDGRQWFSPVSICSGKDSDFLCISGPRRIRRIFTVLCYDYLWNASHLSFPTTRGLHAGSSHATPFSRRAMNTLVAMLSRAAILPARRPFPGVAALVPRALTPGYRPLQT
jgi:hypothetical protein